MLTLITLTGAVVPGDELQLKAQGTPELCSDHSSDCWERGLGSVPALHPSHCSLANTSSFGKFPFFSVLARTLPGFVLCST